MTDETLTEVQIGDHGSNVAVTRVARFSGLRAVGLTVTEAYAPIAVDVDSTTASVDLDRAQAVAIRDALDAAIAWLDEEHAAGRDRDPRVVVAVGVRR